MSYWTEDELTVAATVTQAMTASGETYPLARRYPLAVYKRGEEGGEQTGVREHSAAFWIFWIAVAVATLPLWVAIGLFWVVLEIFFVPLFRFIFGPAEVRMTKC